VFMLDAPLAALVSVSIWLLLASEDFSRPGVSALAGLAVGLGLNTKAQFALYVAGLAAILLARGGWRNWRGWLLFAGAAAVVGAPWYLIHLSELGKMLERSSGGPGTPPANIPPRFSADNLTWYFWDILDGQLLVPLALLAAGGAAWLTASLVRGRGQPAQRMELLGGALTAWLVITFVTTHHDIRYGLPMLGYLAVLGTGWIACVGHSARLALLAVLTLGVSANMLGIDFGVGREVAVAVPHPLPGQLPRSAVVYSATGFLAGAPSRDGDVPGLLHGLRREGVRYVVWSIAQSSAPDFSAEGLSPLARIAGLSPAVTSSVQYTGNPVAATLVHEAVSGDKPPPCTRLDDGTGVWVVRFDTAAGKLAYFCPARRQRYYGLGTVS